MSWSFDTNKGYTRQDISPSATVLGKFTVSILRYGISASGAELVVTDGHLILNPINTDAARAILRELASRTGTPVLDDILSKIEQTGLTEPIAIPRETIRSIEPSGGGGWFRPPSIRIALINEQTIDLGVLHSVTTPNWSEKNVVARDQALRLLGVAPKDVALGAEAAQTANESIPDLIRQLAALRDKGLLSDEEFDAKKAELLERM